MSEPNTMQLSFPQRDVAMLVFDDPQKGANVLSQHVLEEFSAHLDALEKRKDLAGLVICSGKPGMFIAGADLREFAAAKDVTPEFTREMCTRGRRLFQRLSKTPFVTVAAIDGICLGGGAELAMWCDRRLMTADPKAQYGLPEVKLGLFPGWGGTARLPRIIGLSNAVELICGGEPIDGRAAGAMGLTSDTPPSDRLQAAAVALARQEQAAGAYRQDRQRWDGPIDITETELTFLGATGSAYIQQQTKGQYPAPLAALEVMLSNAHADIETACQAEAEGMSQLFGTPINRALINVFFLTDRNKKDTGVGRTDLKPGTVKSLSVFGAGIMGSAIAAVAVKRGVSVAITDVSPAGLQKGVQHILEEVSYNKALKGPDVKKALELAPLVNATVSDSELAASDLLLEAVVENEKIKKELFARLEPQLKDETILATNTSTIPIGRLADGLKHPERFCGIHFFNPVRKMPLVEVIRGPKTSDQTVVTAVGFAKAIGKSPIVVYDGPGFLVNRILFPYLQEALELIQDGVPIEQVERCAKRFGMPMGPITLYDVIGLDTAFYAGSVMYEAFPDRCAASPLMVAMVKANRLGQKTGVGFYSYKDGKERGRPDPTLQPILEQAIRKRDKLSDEQVTHRLFLPMLLEATRILQEKKVRDPRDVDLGLIFGLGFPPHKGGLLFWADQVGAAKILEWLKPLESLGPRTQPTEMLKEMARTGAKFYSTG
jgi:3-hydroxyacyl-CoA dehydrogenase/enoyl-CoA hydratase/3-hydroxybutyryl-CoA epimerase/3-hydroxyacyl-CoA dehydrogenase/enoyl-CoA hydratase/3-hydroxybutyryl-CoA epimerase/enoyl-CoA isomerase